MFGEGRFVRVWRETFVSCLCGEGLGGGGERGLFDTVCAIGVARFGTKSSEKMIRCPQFGKSVAKWVVRFGEIARVSGDGFF